MKPSRVRSGAAVLLSILLVVASGGAALAAETVKIGVMYSTTGPGAPVGKIQIDGVKLAIKQANDRGGVALGGKRLKVEPVIRDDETKPDVAVRRLREYLNDNIRLIVGGTFAHVSTAINEQIRGGQAYFMATNGVAEKVFRKDEKAPYYISTLGAVDGIGRMSADYELVRDYIGIDKPFDVKTTYTNEFLDRSVKMTK